MKLTKEEMAFMLETAKGMAFCTKWKIGIKPTTLDTIQKEALRIGDKMDAKEDLN